MERSTEDFCRQLRECVNSFVSNPEFQQIVYSMMLAELGQRQIISVQMGIYMSPQEAMNQYIRDSNEQEDQPQR